MTEHSFTSRATTTTTARAAGNLGRELPLALPVESMTNSRHTWWELPKVQLRARNVLRLASRTRFLVAAGAAASREPALARCHWTCDGKAPRSCCRWGGDRGSWSSASSSQAGAVSTVRGCVAAVRRGLSARLSLPLLLLSVFSFFRARTDEEMPAAGGVR